jgi:ribosomal-protein-alanine N-acetyltransferase
MTPLLTSERLYYKPLTMEHFSIVYVNWMNDPEVYRYLETGGNYTPEKLKEYLEMMETKTGTFIWAIHKKEDDKHIGNIKIDAINERHQLGEYAIMMGDRTEWKKGYATEATLRILKYCMDELKLRKITLGVVADNATAVELYKKIGFEIEGVYKRHCYFDGHYCDALRMAFFNPDIRY